MKSAMLKVPGTKCLKVKHDKLLSNLAFNFNGRRYIKGGDQVDQPKQKDEKGETEWEMSRVVTLASCLECSSSSGPGAPLSIYSKLAALAGGIPDYLYGWDWWIVLATSSNARLTVVS